MVDPTARRFCRDALPFTDDLYRRARHITGNRADAEDLVQETLVKALIRFDRYREENKMRGWLFRIMHTTWIDMYRVRRARPEEVLTREFSEYQTQMIGAESVEDRVLDRLPDADIAEAFRQLPADFRAVLYFADVQGYRTSEIADLLDTPVGTVSSRLHRGRTKLRGLLADTASARGYGALT